LVYISLKDTLYCSKCNNALGDWQDEYKKHQQTPFCPKCQKIEFLSPPKAVEYIEGELKSAVQSLEILLINGNWHRYLHALIGIREVGHEHLQATDDFVFRDIRFMVQTTILIPLIFAKMDKIGLDHYGTDFDTDEIANIVERYQTNSWLKYID
jgi:hypothetical protein